MFFSIFAERIDTGIRQKFFAGFCAVSTFDIRFLCMRMSGSESEFDNFFQADTTYARFQSAEIGIAQLLTQTYSFEYFCPTIRTDGADTHLAHYFEQTFTYGFDVILLGCGIIQLNVFVGHQLVEYSESHVGIKSTGSEPEQQGCMHHLTYFSTFNDKGCLYTLAYRNQVMMYGADSQQ